VSEQSRNPACGLDGERCAACTGATPALAHSEIQQLLGQLHEDWALDPAGRRISRRVALRGYLRVMAFANSVAWIAETQQHHPDLRIGYASCTVEFTTHAIGGLSRNDFICAARVDALLR